MMLDAIPLLMLLIIDSMILFVRY